MTIRHLPPQLVNQIAAGEVVERPANVVKELVENSLDSGATSVRIEVDGGGHLRIAVHDDGSGIPPEELALAIESHATSKIASLEDLFAVESYGFRGEALACIASVADLKIVSRMAAADVGAALRSRGGVTEPVVPEQRNQGTSIEVCDLFFNTPARRKFLKSNATESAHVVETVLRVALARTDVEFELVSGGRKALRLERGQSLEDRIASGYGKELAQSLLKVDGELEGMRLSGRIAPPAEARARTAMQHLYVNDRFVRDRTVQGAVRRAFSDFLAESLSPVYFLFLRVPPDEVDCNVHPTKIEVRLRRSADLYRLVLSSVDRALREADLAPRVRVAGAFPGSALHFRSAPAGDPGGALASAVQGTPDNRPLQPSLGRSWPEAGRLESTLFERLEHGAGGRTRALLTGGRYVQVLETYIVTTCADGLLILDQHALHERVVYRHLREQWRQRQVQRQELLVPIRVELAARDVLILDESREILESIGLKLSPFGKTEVAVSAVPASIGTNDVPGLLKRVLSFVADERPEGRLDDFADRMLFTMACHRAVRAGDVLNDRQIQELLEEAESIEHAHTCPHGRPTRIVIPRAELENLFKRRGF